MSAPLVANSQPHRAMEMASPTSTEPAAAASGHHLDSALLLMGQKAVTIVHNGTPYRLQATRLGKLILTK